MAPDTVGRTRTEMTHEPTAATLAPVHVSPDLRESGSHDLGERDRERRAARVADRDVDRRTDDPPTWMVGKLTEAGAVSVGTGGATFRASSRTLSGCPEGVVEDLSPRRCAGR